MSKQKKISLIEVCSMLNTKKILSEPEFLELLEMSIENPFPNFSLQIMKM